MFRKHLKCGVARVLTRSGLVRCGISISRSYRKLPLILTYHRVVEDFPASATHSIPSMLISAPMFEAHLDWVGRRFRFESLDEIGKRLVSGEPFDRPVAAITLDDGYRDVYEVAFPILQRKGIPAGVFVSTEFISREQTPLHDLLFILAKNWARGTQPERDPQKLMRLLIESLPYMSLKTLVSNLEHEIDVAPSHFEQFRPMTWDMIKRLRCAGYTIGSHTRNHVLMSSESLEDVYGEALGSRVDLESKLETEVRHFAYPSGAFNAAVTRVVGRAGYSFGYTGCSHRDPRKPLLSIPRRILWQNSCVDASGRFSPDIMACLISNIFDLVSPCTERHYAEAAIAEPAC